MRRLLLGVLSLALAAGLLSAPALAHHRPGHGPKPTPTPTTAPTPTPTPAPTPPPSECPAGRIFLESQGWWKGDGVESQVGADMPFGSHVHVGTCFPWGQVVSGTVEFDVRILLHDNLGQLRRLQPQLWTDQGDTTHDEQFIAQSFPSGNAEVWRHISIDTTRSPVDGYQELRLFTQVLHPDGSEQYASTGWQLNISNGNPIDHYRDGQETTFTEARGWYSGAEYTNAKFESPVPFAPVSGTWSPDLHTLPGFGGTPVTFSAVYIDPDFHNGSSGTTVKTANGTIDGATPIDTTTLADGPHRLVIRADSTISSGTNSGLLVVPFVVDNP